MIYYEDIVPGVPGTFGRYEVTREEVIDFARKYDPQDFHLDDEAAAKGPFGQLAASGWHTAAITMRMIADNKAETDERARGGAGVDNLRWIRPVIPGDVLSVRRTCLDKRRSKSRPDIGIVRSLNETLDAAGEPVCQFESIVMFETRSPTGED